MNQGLPAPSLLRLAGAWDIQPPARGGKRVLRHLIKQMLFLCYLGCGWVQLRDALQWLAGRSRIVIVYYHRVGWVDFVSKPAKEFRREVDYLRRNYRCMTMEQMVQLLASDKPIRGKVAVITFDDGYRDNYLVALPVLKQAGVPATFFVSTGYISSDRVFPHDHAAQERGQSAREDWGKLSWEELRQMQRAGMEIGSHTVNHADLGSADRSTIQRELVGSMQDLQRQLSERPRCFCFPWGKAQNISDDAIKEIKAAGYYAAATTLPGAVRRGDDILQLRRIDVGNGHLSRLGARAAIEGLGCGWLAHSLRKQRQ